MIEYYTIALIAFFAAISPGPDFLVVAKNALSHNRHSAIMASLGIGVGIIIHSVYCVLGLAIIISHSLLMFSIIKYLGAAYLIYLGIKNLFAKNSQLPLNTYKKSNHSMWLAFRDGLLTNILNPKCTLFMLSVFTLLIKPHTSTTIQATYGLEIAFITAAWFIFLSYGLTIALIKQRIEKVQAIVTKLIGGILVTLGTIVMFESR